MCFHVPCLLGGGKELVAKLLERGYTVDNTVLLAG